MNFTSVAGITLTTFAIFIFTHSFTYKFCIFVPFLIIPFCYSCPVNVSVSKPASLHILRTRYCPSHLISNTTHRELRRIIFPSLSTVLYVCKSLDTEAYLSDVGVCVWCMSFARVPTLSSFIRLLRITLYMQVEQLSRVYAMRSIVRNSMHVC